MSYFQVTCKQVYSAIAIILVFLFAGVVVYNSVSADRSLSIRTDALQDLAKGNRVAIDSLRDMMVGTMQNGSTVSINNNGMLKSLHAQVDRIDRRIDRMEQHIEKIESRINELHNISNQGQTNTRLCNDEF